MSDENITLEPMHFKGEDGEIRTFINHNILGPLNYYIYFDEYHPIYNPGNVEDPPEEE